MTSPHSATPPSLFVEDVECSLGWDDGAIVAVDQRALPQRHEHLRIETVDDLIAAIQSLAIRGAPAIGVAGALGVALAAYTRPLAMVAGDANRIATARPTAVNLRWAVQKALAALPEGPKAVLNEALNIARDDIRVNRDAAAHAADYAVDHVTSRPMAVLTHCNTGRLATVAHGTALGAIRELARRGLLRDVLVDETRPLLQGARLTTWELAEAGIPHRLIVDSAASWAMATEQVDCVLVGADRVAANGDVANKIGTLGLALAARHYGIPFVVVCPESTRDTTLASGSEIVVEERSPDELTHVGGVLVAPAEVDTFNPAFDVTPAHLVSAVITENGQLAVGVASQRGMPDDRGSASGPGPQ